MRWLLLLLVVDVVVPNADLDVVVIVAVLDIVVEVVVAESAAVAGIAFVAAFATSMAELQSFFVFFVISSSPPSSSPSTSLFNRPTHPPQPGKPKPPIVVDVGGEDVFDKLSFVDNKEMVDMNILF